MSSSTKGCVLEHGFSSRTARSLARIHLIDTYKSDAYTYQWCASLDLYMKKKALMYVCTLCAPWQPSLRMHTHAHEVVAWEVVAWDDADRERSRRTED